MALPIASTRPVVRSCPSRPKVFLGLLARGRRVLVNALEDEPMRSLTAEEAGKILGVNPKASFDEVLQKKNLMISQAGSDQDKIMELEAAYDVVFMQSMKRRITGETNVSTSVRYADVPPEPPRRGPQAQRSGSQKSISILKMPSGRGGSSSGGGGALAVAQPSQQMAVQQSAVFGALAFWAILQGVFESPEAQMADTAGIQLSLSLAYSVYSLKEYKKMDLGKAVGLSLTGLVVGALLGTVVANWLRVDIVPLGSFQSPGILCTEFAILTGLLGTLFLI